MGSIEKNKILLKAAFRRYDEEKKRIELIDTKTNYLIVLTGIILTIYCNFILKFIHSSNGILPLLFIPVGLYIFSLIFFMKSIFLVVFNSTPDTKYLVNYFDDDEKDENDIIDNIIYNLDHAINANIENIKKKIINWKRGYLSLGMGMIIMVFCIIIHIIKGVFL